MRASADAQRLTAFIASLRAHFNASFWRYFSLSAYGSFDKRNVSTLPTQFCAWFVAAAPAARLHCEISGIQSQRRRMGCNRPSGQRGYGSAGHIWQRRHEREGWPRRNRHQKPWDDNDPHRLTLVPRSGASPCPVVSLEIICLMPRKGDPVGIRPVAS